MPAQKDKEQSEKSRRPGRPRGKAAGADNREQLMDIALKLFSQQGIARVSLNAIAKEAGVTPAMLHYYFNSREALVDQILEERFMPLRNRIATAFSEHPDDPLISFTLMVKVLAELADRHAWFAPLWMQEMIGEMPILRQHMHARFGHDKHHKMLETLARWQEEGKLNRELSPELLITTLISLVLVPFSRLRTDERLKSVTPDTIVRHALTIMGQGIGG
ncbi:TetR/AcrR family transcriptional regulator [Enterobacteriaceae bacterium 89]|jgi:TetR/AcrR family transcriptional regulator|nr:TetR/AcrR family transcriptional regulator [Enterobacteriaceae bacterium 89]